MSIPTRAASIFQREKRRVPREARLRLPWSVWADAHDLVLSFQFEIKETFFKHLTQFPESPPNAMFRPGFSKHN